MADTTTVRSATNPSTNPPSQPVVLIQVSILFFFVTFLYHFGACLDSISSRNDVRRLRKGCESSAQQGAWYEDPFHQSLFLLPPKQ